jgi:hypothetical protein
MGIKLLFLSIIDAVELWNCPFAISEIIINVLRMSTGIVIDFMD